MTSPWSHRKPVANRMPGRLVSSPVSFLCAWSNRNYSHMRVRSENKHQVCNRSDHDSKQHEGACGSRAPWNCPRTRVNIGLLIGRHARPRKGPDSAKLRVFCLQCGFFFFFLLCDLGCIVLLLWSLVSLLV